MSPKNPSKVICVTTCCCDAVTPFHFIIISTKLWRSEGVSRIQEAVTFLRKKSLKKVKATIKEKMKWSPSKKEFQERKSYFITIHFSCILQRVLQNSYKKECVLADLSSNRVDRRTKVCVLTRTNWKAFTIFGTSCSRLATQPPSREICAILWHNFKTQSSSLKRFSFIALCVSLSLSSWKRELVVATQECGKNLNDFLAPSLVSSCDEKLFGEKSIPTTMDGYETTEKTP